MKAADEKARASGNNRTTMEHVLYAWLTMDRDGALANALRERGVTAEVVARICRFGDQALLHRLEGLTYQEKVAMHRKLTEVLAAPDVAWPGL